MKVCIILVCLLCTVYISSGYNILVVFPVPSRSHNILGRGIVDALLDAGHQVTWATSYPPENTIKGLKVINLNATRPFIEAINWMEQVKPDVSLVRGFSRNISRTALSTPALRDVIVNGKFDAVVTEAFFSDVDAGYAAVMKVPWIIFSSVVMMTHFEQQMHEVQSVSTIPILFNSAHVPMSFFERVFNSILQVAITIDGWLDYPNLVSFYERLFTPVALAKGVTLPEFKDAFYNVSILFINSHPSFAHALSLPHNVVEVGGFHIKDDVPPLPKDLKDILDASSEGAIYFSMGSILKSTDFPNKTKRDLLEIFGKLPFTFLWKFEGKFPNLPKNVYVRSWMPQSSILAHPNVKLFITHGGLLSILEALHHGIPMLTIPVYGDQPANAFRAVGSGYALNVPYHPEMSREIGLKLEELMINDSYYKKAKYVSRIFRNRPVAPSKLIPHYIEASIESKGAFHLRSKSQLYSWYQRWMLDQALAAFIALYILVKALKVCINTLKRRRNVYLKEKLN